MLDLGGMIDYHSLLAHSTMRNQVMAGAIGPLAT